MIVRWWPAAPEAWDWMPALYVAGILAALAPAVLVFVVARLRGTTLRTRHYWLLGSGTALLLVALSWPVADLAQVMLTGRALQYLLITLGAPPLLLLGVPRWRATGRGLARRILERLAGAPWVGALVLGVAAVATHVPAAVNAEDSALIQAAIRGAWFASAVLYWWPILGPGPERERLPYLASLGYLVLPFVFPKFPAVIWVFSAEPLYERYVQASAPWGMSLTADQGLGGFILWFPGSVVVAVAIYLLIRHWMREDRRLGLRQRLGVPADPEAVSTLMAHPDAWRVLEALVRIVDDAAPPRLGSDLAFATRGDRVVLQLHVPAGHDDQDALVRTIEAGYAAHLSQYPSTRAEVIRAHLAIEVLPYGARVQ